MSDLLADPRRMTELYTHLVEREARIPFFYCDHRGLVTIAIGYLVDRGDAADAVGLDLAQGLARRGDGRFVRASGSRASEGEVAADWRRVKDPGRTHPGAPWSAYRSVAQLRVTEATIRNLTRDIVGRFVRQLYARRPYIREYDPRVANGARRRRVQPRRGLAVAMGLVRVA